MITDNKLKEYSETEESTDEYIARCSSSEEELRETIAFLMHHTELLKDMEIEQLEAQTDELISEVADKRCEILLTELRCFKEILSLHKRFIGRK